MTNLYKDFYLKQKINLELFITDYIYRPKNYIYVVQQKIYTKNYLECTYNAF